MYIILIILIVLIFVYCTAQKNNIEHLTSTNNIDCSCEAIQNIASLYNTQKMNVTEANITGNATITGNLSVSGGIGGGLSKATTVYAQQTGAKKAKHGKGLTLLFTGSCPNGSYLCGLDLNNESDPNVINVTALKCCPFK